jgi:hypothetical protein
MDLFERLRETTIQAQQEEDLPDFLAERIFRIVEESEYYRHIPEQIEALIDQVAQYDTFGQTGYIGMGVDHFILEKTIGRVEEQQG